MVKARAEFQHDATPKDSTAATPGGMPGFRPSLHVVIVNWRSGPLVDRCLAALAASAQTAFRLHAVTVVDNSAGDAAPYACPDLALPLRLIRPLENLGFGAACNRAVVESPADHFLFLNPDVTVGPDTLDRAVQRISRNVEEGIGALGVRLLDPDGRAQPSCSRFPSFASLALQTLGLHRATGDRIAGPFLSLGDDTAERDVDQVMGAFLLVPAPVFRAAGGFDPGFFLYFEDVDFCRRLHRMGLRVLHLGGVTAVHVGQGSTAQAVGWRTFLLAASRLRYCRREFGRGPAALLCMMILWLEPGLRQVQALLSRRPGALAEVRTYRRLLRSRRTELVATVRSGEGGREGPVAEPV